MRTRSWHHLIVISIMAFSIFGGTKDLLAAEKSTPTAKSTKEVKGHKPVPTEVIIDDKTDKAPSATNTPSPNEPASPFKAVNEDTMAAPPINKLSEAAKITDYFAWKGIGGYRDENKRYRVEILGTLSRGRFVKKNTLIQKNENGNWVTLNSQKLEDYDYEFEYSSPDFAFRMSLPKGQYRIQAALFIDSENFSYDFEFETSDKWPPVPPPSTKIYLCQKCLTLGAGLNYINYQQSPPGDLDPVNYSVFTALPISIEGRWALNRKHAVRFEYHRQSGSSLEANNITLNNNNIEWSYFTIGGDSILKSNGKLFGISYSNGFLYGLQYHSVPFLRIDDASTYTLIPFKLFSLGAGGYTGVRVLNSEVIFSMRMQIAVSGQGDVKLQSGLSFDGSLNYLSEINPDSYWGIYWGGQFHSYKYSVESSGTYSLVLSKIEALWGYRF